jgi:copper homeostasis protein
MIKVEISRQALEDLIGLGIDQVLTSGQEALCLEGLEMIAALRNQAAGRIIVLPGGWLTERNVRKIVHATGVSEVHLSARSSVESSMVTATAGFSWAERFGRPSLPGRQPMKAS